MYCDVDGRFPNHHPDPSKPENLRDLIAVLAEGKHDLGLAFDGDGDRLGVVDARRPRDLSRPAADAVRRRRARARARRDDHLRRQVDAQPEALDPAPRRRAAALEDRAFADQEQDEGGRRGACRRDERTHLLQGALVRLRRRALRGRATARDPGAAREPVGGARRAAGRRVDSRTEHRVRGGRAPRAHREARRVGEVSTARTT